MKEPSNPGWVEDPAEVDAQTVMMGGNSILFGNSEFKGTANKKIAAGVTGVFPHLSERKFFGKFKPSFIQYRGTCVGQGTARAVQDSYYHQLDIRGLVGRLVDIAVAPIYAGARIAIGRGRISGDGAVGAWAAKYIHDYKLVARQIVGNYNLLQQNGDENYAVSWGKSGAGVPRTVVEAGEATCRVFRCTTQDDIADAAWAGFALQFCGNRTYSAKDKNGVSRLNKPTNHCTEAVGACLSTGGQVLIGGQQSWGDDAIAGPEILRYKGGEVDLRAGMTFVPLEDYYKTMKSSGEMWAIQVVDSFRPRTVDEIV
jgi:hypothetical protein